MLVKEITYLHLSLKSSLFVFSVMDLIILTESYSPFLKHFFHSKLQFYQTANSINVWNFIYVRILHRHHAFFFFYICLKFIIRLKNDNSHKTDTFFPCFFHVHRNTKLKEWHISKLSQKIIRNKNLFDSWLKS